MRLLFRARRIFFFFHSRQEPGTTIIPVLFICESPRHPPPHPRRERLPWRYVETFSQKKSCRNFVRYIKFTITIFFYFVFQHLLNLRLNAKTIHTLLIAKLFDKLTTVAFVITRKLAVKPARTFFQTVIIKIAWRIISETSLCSPSSITKQSAHAISKEACHFKTAMHWTVLSTKTGLSKKSCTLLLLY